MNIENLDALHEIVFSSDNPHVIVHRNTQTDNYSNHWHSPLEILMPIENHYTAYINTREYHLRPFDILFVTPNVYHAYIAPSTGSRYFILIDISTITDILGINQVISMLNPGALFTPENAPTIYPELRNLVMSICDIYMKKAEYEIAPVSETPHAHSVHSFNLSETMIYSRLFEMLALIAQNYTLIDQSPVLTPERDQDFINKFTMICNYIDTHCREDLSLEEVSRMSNFSKYHFSRLFKEFAHESFYKYVNRKRILYAQQMLQHQNTSITEIALTSGYSSTSSFTRMFKQISGCTPRQYRENMRKANRQKTEPGVPRVFFNNHPGNPTLPHTQGNFTLIQ